MEVGGRERRLPTGPPLLLEAEPCEPEPEPPLRTEVALRSPS